MNRSSALFTVVVAASLGLASGRAYGQGSLTPPAGAPAPVMKTLDQVQPRTPIATAPFTISAPGSYYLAANLTVTAGDAITINADNVVLDLNGFTINSTFPGGQGDGNGIIVSGDSSASPHRNIQISNGFIKSPVTFNQSNGSYGVNGGFLNGIRADFAVGMHVTEVSVEGVRNNGIELAGGESVVEACTVRVCTGDGIFAQLVVDSTAAQAGSIGISAFQAMNCRGDGTNIASGAGLSASVATNCYGGAVGGTGLSSLTASSCYGMSTSGTALNATTAWSCYGAGNTGTALQAQNATACFGASGSSFGINTQVAIDCHASSGTGTGLFAVNAVNCHALSTSALALNATNATNCFASGAGQFGMQVTNADNCYVVGTSTGLTTSTATNCYVQGSFQGLSTSLAIDCFGTATSGAGVSVTTSAVNCFGHSGGSGAGVVSGETAVGCFGTSTTGTGLTSFIGTSCLGNSTSVTHKYQMP